MVELQRNHRNAVRKSRKPRQGRRTRRTSAAPSGLVLFAWQEGYGASQREAVRKYIENQEEHHRKKTFQEEYVEFLEAYDVEYDEKYLW